MKSKLTYIIVFLVFMRVAFGYGQETKNKDSISIFDRYLIFEGDTLLVELEEIKLLGKLSFKSDYDRRYYYWYRKKTLNAYPYAKLAADRLEVLNERLSKIESNRKKKNYIKIVQKYMEGEFTDQLKKLTRTEGEILIKLIHRQTGETAFDLVKGLRSGWKAFWYNTTANVFKLSLKDEFNPVLNKEDYLIEDILQRAFIDGILEEQPSKLEYDFLALSKKWIEAPKPPAKKR
jgi:hypothetical protein